MRMTAEEAVRRRREEASLSAAGSHTTGLTMDVVWLVRLDEESSDAKNKHPR